MACRGWLLVVGISCLILAAQGNSTSTVFTTTPTAMSMSTSMSTPTSTSTSAPAPTSTSQGIITKLSTQGSTTQTPEPLSRLRTTGLASTSPSPTTTAPVTATIPTTPPTKSSTTTAPASPTTPPPPTTTTTPATATTTAPAAPTTTPPTPTTTTTTTPATATTAAQTATTAPTTSSNSTTAISSTTSGTTLSTSNNTKSSTPASNTNSTEPTSSEIPTSTEASSATAETSTPSSTVSTSSSVTTTVQPTTTSPPKPNLLINEFTYNGLFSNGTTFNVEIRRLEGDAAPNMTVVVYDLKMKCAAVVQVDSAAWKNNLAFKTAPLTPANRRAVIVSLYTSVQWTSCTDVNMTGVDPLDATIVSQDPVNTMTTSIQFVDYYLSRILVAQVNRSIPQGANLSVVRCDDTRLDPGSFIIAPSTFNQPNSCDLDQDVALKKITLNYTCDKWKVEKNGTKKLITYFVKEVGSRCQCGFSPVYIQNATVNCTHTTTTTISWSIPKKFESEYDNVVNATNCMENVTDDELCLARTCHNCNNSKKEDPKHKGNISVTVGVVVACIVVFLIIVAIVILYIRKKRRGILQFRMTRLDEDDDDLMMSNDTDDFVGGQEASFSNSSYTRFK